MAMWTSRVEEKNFLPTEREIFFIPGDKNGISEYFYSTMRFRSQTSPGNGIYWDIPGNWDLL